MQIEALYALDENHEEGATRDVIQAATGVGKTYLTAFDSVSYKRVLFVSHRQKILQVANSFSKTIYNTRIYRYANFICCFF